MELTLITAYSLTLRSMELPLTITNFLALNPGVLRLTTATFPNNQVSLSPQSLLRLLTLTAAFVDIVGVDLQEVCFHLQVMSELCDLLGGGRKLGVQEGVAFLESLVAVEELLADLCRELEVLLFLRGRERLRWWK